MPDATTTTSPFSLKNIVAQLESTAADLSSLQVMTFTGDVSSALGAGDEIDWANLLKQARNPQGTIKLVAATRLAFDGDSVVFQTDAKLDRLDDLLKLHNSTVELGRQTRSALLSLFTDTLKSFTVAKK